MELLLIPAGLAVFLLGTVLGYFIGRGFALPPEDVPQAQIEPWDHPDEGFTFTNQRPPIKIHAWVDGVYTFDDEAAR